MRLNNRVKKLELQASVSLKEFYVITTAPGGKYRINNEFYDKEQLIKFKENNKYGVFINSNIPRSFDNEAE